MRKIDAVPRVGENATVAEAVLAISRGGMGMTAIVTDQSAVVGIFTDGDLRRALERSSTSGALRSRRSCRATRAPSDPTASPPSRRR
ncbi:MAG: CBS domain-containing protein [Rhodocyclaceae bacterium]|nr:CBS domain-containing protein [Rhodocyclaceae bacterium]